MIFLKWLGGLLTGGVLDRVLSTVDRKIENETDRQKLRADIIMTYYKTRADWMNAGGFWLSLMFALPLAFWFSAVIVYSVLWCAGCAYPQDWHIAALPSPLDDWAGGIILSIFGVIGIGKLRK